VYNESRALSKNLAAIFLLDSIDLAVLSLSLTFADKRALYIVPPFF
jgi:hypothetical protein